MDKKLVVAAFDFDGTLTYRDTLLPFLCFSSGPLLTTCKIALELPQLAAYVAGVCSRQETKEHVLKRFFQGKSYDEIKKTGERFAETGLNQFIKSEGMRRLGWHIKQGHRCILVSANLDLFLCPWAKRNGFHDAITSRCEVTSEGKLTGKLVGLNCWGMEKTHRLRELLGQEKNYILYVYGDSKGDQDLLSVADYAFYRSFSK